MTDTGDAGTTRRNEAEPDGNGAGGRWLTSGVWSVGLASFFSDAGHELATGLLPSFVTHTLGASAGALGLIEGISDGLLGIAKLLGGAAANDERRRLNLARGGYIVTAIVTGALGLVTAVWQAGILRALAWVSRGVRGPARDAMLATLAPPEAYGRAFGLERAGDNLGAVLGPLAAAGLVGWIGIRPSLYLSAIPGALAALAITFAAAEARRVRDPVGRRFRLELGALRRAGLARPLLPVALFELGNCATTLLILRASTLLGPGRSATAATSLAIVLYSGHNLVAALTAYGGGHWIDRAGPRSAFAGGALLFGVAYALFALPTSGWPLLLVAFAVAGAGIGLAETAESALVARLLPDDLRGGGFGVLGGLQSAGDFASSAAVGLLWTAVSPTAAFVYAAGWMALALTATVQPGLMR